MKKLSSKLAYILIGIILAIAGTVYAINVTVPQATQVGQIPTGLSSGNYAAGNLVAGSNITITTSTPGQITISSTGGTSSPAGSNTQIQLNLAGSFGASSNFTYATTTNTLAVTGTSTISNGLLIGATTFASPFIAGQTWLGLQGSFAGYQEVNAQNTSASTTASSNYVLTANNGNANSYYSNFFQNSSGFTNTGGISGGADDAGLFSSDNSLYLGTASTTNTNANLYLVAQNTNIATGTKTGLTISNATSTTLTVTGLTSGNCVQASTNGLLTTTGSACGAGGGVSGGTNGKVAVWTSASTLSSGDLLDNLIVSGVNATSSIVNFNIQGTGTLNPFNVASSSGTSELMVTSNGNVGIGTTTPVRQLEIVAPSTGDQVLARFTNKGGSVGDNASIELCGAAGFFSNCTKLEGQWDGSFIVWNGGSGTPSKMMTLGNGGTVKFNTDPTGNLGTYGIDFNHTASDNTLGYIHNHVLGGFASDLVFGTAVAGSNAIDRMIINTNGLVGIGSSTPSALLTVTGTSSAPTTMLLNVTSSTNNSLLSVLSNGNVGIGTTTQTNALTVIGDISDSNLTSGNCIQASTGGKLTTTGSACGSGGGITSISGMTGPATTINGTTNQVIVSTSSNVMTLSLPQSINTSAAVQFGNIGINTAPVSGFVVTGGNLFIGSALNEKVLNLIGSFGQSSTGDAYYEYFNPTYNAGNATSSSLFANIYMASSTIASNAVHVGEASQLYIAGPITGTSTNGNFAIHVVTGTTSLGGSVGIGTTTPSYGFVNVGTAQLSGLTTSSGLQTAVLCLDANNQVISDSVACLASSKRFKQDINPLDTGLNEVMQLNPISFLYKPSFNGKLQSNPNYNGQQVGFIAEDVQKVDPRLVVVETSGPNKGQVAGFRYENFTAILTKAIQDVEVQITAMFFKLNSLEAENQTLKQEVNELQITQVHQQQQINLLLKQSIK